MGSARYPTERRARAVGIVSVSPDGMDFRAPAGPTSSFLPSFIQRNAPSLSPPNSSGLARKRTCKVFLHPPSSRRHSPASLRFVNASYARRLGRLRVNSSSSSGASASVSSDISTRTSGKFNSSRSSFGVKDACATPRRPINDTDDTGCARNVSNACAQISVSASASASFNNTLAQSIATFPTPITATCAFAPPFSNASRTRACVSLSGPCAGSPLNHATNSLALNTPLRVSSPGTSNRRSPLAPHANTTPWYPSINSPTLTSRPSPTLP